MPTASTIAIGDVLDGKYEIAEILGEGAMGVVYRARHKRLQRTVALKTLREEFAADADLIERFEREARAASAIGHPNIVQVFDAGGDLAGTPYLVMEFLEGQSLGDLLHEEGALDIDRSIDLCCQVLAGLGAAHSAGILHRDLKPDNIFVTKDANGQELAKILDFGISKVLDIADPSIVGDARATRAGTVLGTPLYMSPEQASGRVDVDLRADLWGVVCVLYECVTGKTPFNGENYNQILASVLQGIYVGLQEHRPDAPTALHELVQRGLKVERGDRFPDATSLSVALTSITTENAKTAESVSSDPKMLAAFDNLADRFIAQEREDSVDMAIPDPSPMAATAPAASQAGAQDRFAPPESNAVLSLDLETDPSAPGARVSMEKRATAPRPKQRSHGEQVTREEPSQFGAFLLKSFLAIALVAGAGAAYRYNKLGYILPQDKPIPAHLVLELQPEDVQVYLNNDLTTERELDLENDKDYTLRITADGRLEMRGQWRARTGDSIRVSEKLWHEILKIHPSVVSKAKEHKLTAESAATLAALREKMESFGTCGPRLAKAIEEVLEEKVLVALPRDLTDECGATLDLAIAEEPLDEELDAASKEFREALSGYGQAIANEQRGKGKRGRAQESKKAARELKRAADAWGAAMSSLQTRWHQLELMRVVRSGGDPLHLDVRELALASDAWMRTRLAGGAAKRERAVMMERFSTLSKRAGRRTEEFKTIGVTSYLNALRPLLDKEPGEDALFWHNQSVEVFNRLRLPLQVAIDSADQ